MAQDQGGERRIRSVAIVGGGTAGWMAAAMLARALPTLAGAISVIESPEIGTVGVGEATIPPIIDLLKFLSIDEADFIRHTRSTYKLGIRFVDWRRPGASYWHPFGTFGAPINRRPFFHAWHRAEAEGWAPRFNDFSLCAALGDAGLYRAPDARQAGPVAGLRYALHFDAGLVAQYLRAYAEQLGVRRLERTVEGAVVDAGGRIGSLALKGGDSLAADLFIDCSGFRGVLIEQALQTGYVDWTHVLPCDRAVAVPTELAHPRGPYTLSSARAAGWRWRIPLQHRAGNGYVYSSAHVDDETACRDLLAQVGETPLAEPRVLRFTTGRRRRFWNGNCIALGLASGFIEPLESTSIHLVMSGVYNLLEHFPDRDFDPANIAAYNAELIEEIERIRDFVVLHYCATEREDTAFWRHCRAMTLPDSLAERIAVYRASGRVRPRPGELFTDLSWFYVLDGLGVKPASYDPLMDVVPAGQLREILGRMAEATAAGLTGARPHDSYFPAPVRAAAAAAG